MLCAWSAQTYGARLQLLGLSVALLMDGEGCDGLELQQGHSCLGFAMDELLPR